MTWIIGDIHGCYRELAELLGKIPADEPLVFLGDYVDRGPSPRQVVELLLRERHRSVFLMGNHESMLLSHFFRPGEPEGEGWIMDMNGGRATLRSYDLRIHSKWEELPEAHREFYRNLVLFHETADFIAVHAGVRVEAGIDMNRQSREDLLWIRSLWIQNEARWNGKRIYYGHTPTVYLNESGDPSQPLYGKKSVGLDTGCVYGGYLTALRHPDGQLVQVKSGIKFSFQYQ